MATSSYKKPNGKPNRYVVTYENQEPFNEKVITFSVMARSASEATGITIDYIKRKLIHESNFGYTLCPILSNEETDLIINF